LRGRYGDPGLSSRLSLLEMQFRRLLTCPPLTLGEADRAPVGPGVLLLSDSDLSTYYYVEPCQTLRIAIGSYELDHGKVPETLAQLVNGEKHYLDQETVPTDAWGREFKFYMKGDLVKIQSAGSDGTLED